VPTKLTSDLLAVEANPDAGSQELGEVPVEK
jgi:hypothetical protein